MKIAQSILIDDLIAQTIDSKMKAQHFKTLPFDILNAKAAVDVWSCLECIEHLNLYANFYLPELTKVINQAKQTPNEFFHSGWLGNYFANSMIPKEKLNKMKTFKDKNPNGSKLSIDVLDQFLKALDTLLDLLERCRSISLTHNRTGITISKYITLRLGDTLRVVVYHQTRHMLQAERAVVLYN
jgi:DinB superfamily